MEPYKVIQKRQEVQPGMFQHQISSNQSWQPWRHKSSHELGYISAQASLTSGVCWLLSKLGEQQNYCHSPDEIIQGFRHALTPSQLHASSTTRAIIYVIDMSGITNLVMLCPKCILSKSKHSLPTTPFRLSMEPIPIIVTPTYHRTTLQQGSPVATLFWYSGRQPLS